MSLFHNQKRLHEKQVYHTQFFFDSISTENYVPIWMLNNFRMTDGYNMQ